MKRELFDVDGVTHIMFTVSASQKFSRPATADEIAEFTEPAEPEPQESHDQQPQKRRKRKGE